MNLQKSSVAVVCRDATSARRSANPASTRPPVKIDLQREYIQLMLPVRGIDIFQCHVPE
jgi:hypothetical protein